MFSPKNLEAAGLLHDILPEKRWEYCAACSRPRISNLDIEDHPYATAILTTLGCNEHTDLEATATTIADMVEKTVYEYIFPQDDEFTYAVKFLRMPDLEELHRLPMFKWEDFRNTVTGYDKFILWTRKTVVMVNGDVMILPRHFSIGLSFVD